MREEWEKDEKKKRPYNKPYTVKRQVEYVAYEPKQNTNTFGHKCLTIRSFEVCTLAIAKYNAKMKSLGFGISRVNFTTEIWSLNIVGLGANLTTLKQIKDIFANEGYKTTANKTDSIYFLFLFCTNLDKV